MSQSTASLGSRNSPRTNVEMTSDSAFANRIRRLAVTSIVALGAIWFLASAAQPPVRTALAAGWLLMPSILSLSLRLPRLRYALIAPALLVAGSLTALCITTAFNDARVQTGWLLITSGVWLGGILGMWFWYRWLPVPRPLTDPYSRGRWMLIAAHASLIVAGITLLGVAAIG